MPTRQQAIRISSSRARSRSFACEHDVDAAPPLPVRRPRRLDEVGADIPFELLPQPAAMAVRHARAVTWSACGTVVLPLAMTLLAVREVLVSACCRCTGGVPQRCSSPSGFRGQAVQPVLLTVTHVVDHPVVLLRDVLLRLEERRR